MFGGCKEIEDAACKEHVPGADIDEHGGTDGIDVDADEGMALVGGEEIHVREDVVAGEEQCEMPDASGCVC